MTKRTRHRLVLFLLAAAAATAHAQTADADPLLVGYYAVKLGLAGLTVGTALTEPDLAAGERVVLGGGALAVAIPSTLVLIERRRDNAVAVRGWRVGAFAADATLAATAAVYGAWLIAYPGGDLDAQYYGLACLIAGFAGALASGLDLVPFAMERPRP
jgi:hypothetical protein